MNEGTKKERILITGAAGLVGQNLIVLLKESGYSEIIAIDKHPGNIKILRSLHPDIKIVEADLSHEGEWGSLFEGVDALVMAHAQISGLNYDPFEQNNVEATRMILKVAEAKSVPYMVHISSSVVVSVANDSDFYTRSKRVQENIVKNSSIPHCILRPTLMFGWFDPKHLGWLSRFMTKAALFPVPGNGNFLRQPLYARDFCRIIERCISSKPTGVVYDIVGQEEINYIDIIKMIKQVTKAKTLIIKIPFLLFDLLLRFYAIFSKSPPFTSQQLHALVAGDYFKGVDLKGVFKITPTPFKTALEETFTDPRYNTIVLEPTS